MSSKEYMKNWWANNKEKKAEYDRKYRLAHQEELKKYGEKYYQVNKEKLKAKSYKWYQEHPAQVAISRKLWALSNILKVKKSKEKYYIKNKELVKKRARKWIKQNPDKVRGIHRKIYANNRQRYTFYHKQRDRQKRANGGSHTFEQWIELKTKYFNMCLCCKQFEPIIKLTEDHIIPLSSGGLDSIDNIQPLCLSCNSRKSNKFISYLPIIDSNLTIN